MPGTNARAMGRYVICDEVDGTVIVARCLEAAQTETVPAAFEGRRVTGIGAFAFRGLCGVREIVLPQYLRHIEDDAFEDMPELERVTFPASLGTIGACAFRGCAALRDIRLPERLSVIGAYAFCGCASARAVALPDSLKRIGTAAFSGCDALEEITLPGSLAQTGMYAFAACASLARATLREGVRAVSDGAFAGCASLADAALPDSLTRIDADAFLECAALRRVRVPEGVLSISAGAFAGCAALEEIVLPKRLTRIGEGAFEKCVRLASIRLPDALDAIGAEAFSDCAALREITLPYAVTRLGRDCFKGCPRLRVDAPADSRARALLTPRETAEPAPADPAEQNAETIDGAWRCALPQGMRRFPDGREEALPCTFAEDKERYPLDGGWIRVLKPLEAPAPDAGFMDRYSAMMNARDARIAVLRSDAHLAVLYCRGEKRDKNTCFNARVFAAGRVYPVRLCFPERAADEVCDAFLRSIAAL